VPVSLVISTILIETGYLDGSKAQLYLKRHGGFEKVETHTVSNPYYVITVNFTEDVDGPFRMVIRDSGNKLLWRSVELQPHADGIPLRYTLSAIDENRTTLSGSDMTDEVELPMVEDIEDLDEDLVIEKLTVVGHDDYLSVMPSGKVAKGDDWTILMSDFDMKYKMRLTPSTSIRQTRLVGISSVGFEMHFSNPITGIGADCAKEKIRTKLRDTLRSKINRAIRDQMQDQVAGQFGDDNPLNDEVSATVLAVEMVQTGTENVDVGSGSVALPVFSLRLQVDASIPSQLIEQQTSSGGGCLGLVLLWASVASAAILLLF